MGMSTGLNCTFIETKGEWFYLLEDWDAPKMAWDWREYATAYGPFASDDEAHDHLRRHHANPGGANLDRYGDRPLDEVTTQRIAEARR